jgi:aspartate 4-decarboxylase
MSLFSLAEMMDGAKVYQKACMEIVHRRAKAMIEGLGIEVAPNALYNAYYGLIDFEFFARKNIGEDAVEYLKKNVHPLDLAFRLAEDHGIVLLNGGGFEAPDWSLRVSLANFHRARLPTCLRSFEARRKTRPSSGRAIVRPHAAAFFISSLRS